MIKLSQAVIVEGRYDKTTLENIIDALIIPTDGFRIFKDKEKCALIRSVAEKSGIIIMTDSDSAGAMIRAHIKRITDNKNITHVYIPQIIGKEKRKDKPSKEGTLGVEGMSVEIITEALKKSGITGEKTNKKSKKITKNDMFRFGLSGSYDAAEKRKSLLKFLELPDNLSPNAMLDIINTFFSYEEFERKIDLWLQDTDKR